MKKTGLTPGQVLVPVGIGLTFSLFGDATLYTVLPDAGIAAQAGVSLGMVGVLLGLNRLARVVFNGPAGILYDRCPAAKTDDCRDLDWSAFYCFFMHWVMGLCQ